MQIEIVRLLGEGAYADVYEAKDQLGRDVAVKIIRPDVKSDEMALSHAKILAMADHANVVRVLSIERIQDPTDTSREVDAVVMERVAGMTLSDLLAHAADR